MYYSVAYADTVPYSTGLHYICTESRIHNGVAWCVLVLPGAFVDTGSLAPGAVQRRVHSATGHDAGETWRHLSSHFLSEAFRPSEESARSERSDYSKKTKQTKQTKLNYTNSIPPGAVH